MAKFSALQATHTQALCGFCLISIKIWYCRRHQPRPKFHANHKNALNAFSPNSWFGKLWHTKVQAQQRQREWIQISYLDFRTFQLWMATKQDLRNLLALIYYVLICYHDDIPIGFILFERPHSDRSCALPLPPPPHTHIPHKHAFAHPRRLTLSFSCFSRMQSMMHSA